MTPISTQKATTGTKDQGANGRVMRAPSTPRRRRGARPQALPELIAEVLWRCRVSGRWKRSRLIVLKTLRGLIVVGLVSGLTDRGQLASAEAAQAQAGAATASTIQFHSCAQLVPAGAQCGTLHVPLDYSNPTKGMLAKPVIRVLATDRQHRIGVLFVSEGGPWLQYFQGFFSSPYGFASLGNRFDIVALESRGTGGDRPTFCLDTAATDTYVHADPVVDEPAELSQLHDRSRQLAQGCAANNRSLLPYLGSENSARDVDSLRVALGETQLTYVQSAAQNSAVSAVGAWYRALFPTRLRAMMLDGGDDASLSLLDETTQQADAYEASYRAFLAGCRRDPSCPLNPDPGAAIDGVLASLDAQPATVNGRAFGRADATIALGEVMVRDSNLWAYLEFVWAQAVGGRFDALQNREDIITGRSASGFDATIPSAVMTRCADHSTPATEAEVDQAAQAAQARDPHFGAALVYSALPCVYLPAHPAPAPVVIRRPASNPPTLLVNSLHDPADPYRWSQEVHRDLPGSTLLAYDGFGADAYIHSHCVAGAVDVYLWTLQAPSDGLICDGPTTKSAPAEVASQLGNGSIQFHSCAPGVPANAQCGLLPVPLDYRDPTKGTILQRMIRIPALDREHRIGALLVNPGGPGASGVDFVVQQWPTLAPFHPSFDIVGFDPRGTNNPDVVHCESTTRLDNLVGADPIVDDTSERQALLDAARQFADGCQRQSGRLLPYVDSDNVARDVDTLRVALGEGKVSFFGFSYGTVLGTDYARLFPDRVRAMVLDGDVDQSLSFLDQSSQQADSFERSYRAFVAQCQADPYCPLGSNPGGVVDNLLTSLDVKPAMVNGRSFGRGDALTALLGFMYEPDGWSYFTYLLAQAGTGDFSGLQSAADASTGRGPTGYNHSFESGTAVSCADHAVPTDIAVFDQKARQAQARDPHFGAYSVYGALPCAFWPVPRATPSQVSIEGVAHLLLIGATEDPATPYAWSQALHQQIHGSVLLTRQGFGHTSYGRDGCTTGTTLLYLVSRQTPTDGTTCAQ
jgi:pimeloyl-ACP methyl ester carboxylesterase